MCPLSGWVRAAPVRLRQRPRGLREVAAGARRRHGSRGEGARTWRRPPRLMSQGTGYPNASHVSLDARHVLSFWWCAASPSPISPCLRLVCAGRPTPNPLRRAQRTHGLHPLARGVRSGHRRPRRGARRKPPIDSRCPHNACKSSFNLRVPCRPSAGHQTPGALLASSRADATARRSLHHSTRLLPFVPLT